MTKRIHWAAFLISSTTMATCERGDPSSEHARAPLRSGAEPAKPPTQAAFEAESVVPPVTEPGEGFVGEQSMVAVSPDVFVDPAAAPEDRELARQSVSEATQLVEKALGALQAPPPLVYFCDSDPCRLYFTGPTMRSKTLGPGRQVEGAGFVTGERTTVIIVSIDRGARDVLVHELVHVELSARVGAEFVPAWFHEGVATLVSNAPNCEAHVGGGIDDLSFLDGHEAWNAYTDRPNNFLPTYCQARNEVDEWIDRHGKRRLHDMIREVGKGASFYVLYGSVLTECTESCGTW